MSISGHSVPFCNSLLISKHFLDLFLSILTTSILIQAFITSTIRQLEHPVLIILKVLVQLIPYVGTDLGSFF